MGNFIIVDKSLDEHRITLANIYAPNNDEPSFFEKLENNIKFHGNINVIIVGDWNLLLDPSIDGKNYKHVNNKKLGIEWENLLIILTSLMCGEKRTQNYLNLHGKESIIIE